MIKKITLSLVAVVAISALAFKAPKVHTSNYTLDNKLTTATWLAKKVTGEHTGGITITSGTMSVDHGAIKTANFEFDMNSITCTDLTDAAWNKKLIDHLKNDDFFSSAKYPTAKFELTKATVKEGNNYDVTGNLTIKGVTKEISFPALIKMDDKKIVTVATVKVDRTKYDIKYGSKNFIEGIGDKAIDDEFELKINVVATAK